MFLLSYLLQAIIAATLATETLLKCEEVVSAATTAESVALARAVVEVAKMAALKIGMSDPPPTSTS